MPGILKYLGLSGSGTFSVEDVKAQAIILQVFSMYCPYCQKDAPNVNRLFGLIENNPNLKGKIKIIGIGAGNSPFEVATFKKKYKVEFALVPDGDFKIHKIVGEVRTPYFIVVKMSGPKKPEVVFSKLGAHESVEAFLADVIKDWRRCQIGGSVMKKRISYHTVPDWSCIFSAAQRPGGFLMLIKRTSIQWEKLKPVDSVLKVKVGQKAPDFTLKAVSGKTVSLKDFKGKKNVVLSFVPAAWTPVCSDQWPGYNIVQDLFEENHAVLLGITVDNIPTLYSWTRQMGDLWFDVLSDFWPHGAVASRYGILRTDGTAERAIIIIDQDGYHPVH